MRRALRIAIDVIVDDGDNEIDDEEFESLLDVEVNGTDNQKLTVMETEVVSIEEVDL